MAVSLVAVEAKLNLIICLCVCTTIFGTLTLFVLKNILMIFSEFWVFVVLFVVLSFNLISDRAHRMLIWISNPLISFLSVVWFLSFQLFDFFPFNCLISFLSIVWFLSFQLFDFFPFNCLISFLSIVWFLSFQDVEFLRFPFFVAQFVVLPLSGPNDKPHRLLRLPN